MMKNVMIAMSLFAFLQPFALAEQIKVNGGSKEKINRTFSESVNVEVDGKSELTGSIKVEGDQSVLTVHTNGESNVVLEGSCKKLRIFVDGKSSVDLSKLTAEEVEVFDKMNGVSSLKVRAGVKGFTAKTDINGKSNLTIISEGPVVFMEKIDAGTVVYVETKSEVSGKEINGKSQLYYRHCAKPKFGIVDGGSVVDVWK